MWLSLPCASFCLKTYDELLSSQGNQVDILASYLLLPDNILPLVQVGWSLIYEIYFYLVFFLIMLFLPEKFLSLSVLAWAFAIIFLKPSFENPYITVIYSPLTFEFLAGCILAIHFYKSSELHANKNVLVIAAGAGYLATILAYIFFQQQIDSLTFDVWRTIYFGIPAAIIVFCITHVERKQVVLPNWLVQIGNASYSIYLSHLFTINVVGRVWREFSVDAVYDNWIALAIAALLAILVGFISYKWIELPLLKLSRRLA
jgi:peptidoglycan/LPS O-acetylase OafA/YrhL